MATNPTRAKAGLEDVVALDSEICFIDGRLGRLVYRGYDINDLVGQASFEEVVYLLWHGELPTLEQLAALRKQIAEEQPLPEAVLKLLRALPAEARPMAMLRTAVSALGLFDPEAEVNTPEANLRKAARLVAKTATIVAAIHRLRQGREPIAPRSDLGIAANFLYMMRGALPDELPVKAFDAALILHADHELNASTFAARVTAATLSDIYSAVTSAIGALKGPLHGGANEQVMRMLVEIGEPEAARAYVEAKLGRGEKIMGFGHRVYKTDDPRALHLKRFAKELGERIGEPKWYQISLEVEAAMREAKGIFPNVDFYSASTYHAMGIPRELFTPIFAVSRMSGWTAHVLEQFAHNRLIRPRAEYVGPESREFVPLERRRGGVA